MLTFYATKIEWRLHYTLQLHSVTKIGILVLYLKEVLKLIQQHSDAKVIFSIHISDLEPQMADQFSNKRNKH